MSAEGQSTQVRSHWGRKVLLGIAASSAGAVALWKALILPASSARDHAPSLPILDGKTIGLYFWIAVGSALGGVARYWLSGVAARLFGETFPWGTIIINVSGSFVIGFFATLTGPDGRVLVGSTTRQFVMVGICGASQRSHLSACRRSIWSTTENGCRPAGTSAHRLFYA